jgi:hypothetical protein
MVAWVETYLMRGHSQSPITLSWVMIGVIGIIVGRVGFKLKNERINSRLDMRKPG